MAEQLRDDLAFEGLEGLRVAEEVGHADQQVAQQRLGLFGSVA